MLHTCVETGKKALNNLISRGQGKYCKKEWDEIRQRKRRKKRNKERRIKRTEKKEVEGMLGPFLLSIVTCLSYILCK